VWCYEFFIFVSLICFAPESPPTSGGVRCPNWSVHSCPGLWCSRWERISRPHPVRWGTTVGVAVDSKLRHIRLYVRECGSWFRRGIGRQVPDLQQRQWFLQVLTLRAKLDSSERHLRGYRDVYRGECGVLSALDSIVRPKCLYQWEFNTYN
jgi:hypothetical protein